MLFELAGRKPKFISVPVGLMDFIIGAMETIGKVIPSVGVRTLALPKLWRTLGRSTLRFAPVPSALRIHGGCHLLEIMTSGCWCEDDASSRTNGPILLVRLTLS